MTEECTSDNTRMRRVVVSVASASVAIAAVAGAVSAAPGPETGLHVRAGADVEKFAGNWKQVNDSGNALGPKGSLRLTGTEKDPKQGKDILQGLLDFGGEQHCPDDPDAALTKAKEKITQAGKSFDPGDSGGQEGYNKTGAEFSGNTTATGDYGASVEKGEIHGGEQAQIVEGSGFSPACDESVTYFLNGAFTKGGKSDGWLYPNFKGGLYGSSPDGGANIELKAGETD